MKTFKLDCCAASKPLERYWEMCVGSCHAATALRSDYQEMLTRCNRELGFRYVRFHGIFNDDMSVVQKPMFAQEPILSFTNIDKIFDFLLSIGMKPFIELSFMPEALASGTNTLFHYKGNTTPPRDYDQWAWLIRSFAEHLIARYGRDEVRQWFFEVWNEPNLGGPDSPFGFWSADMQEYFKLYRVTAHTLKQVDSVLRVGGPATSNNAWIPEMVGFCRESGTPIDFITTHQYPTDVVLGYGVEDSGNFVNPLDISDPERIKSVVQMAMQGGEAFERFKQEYSVFQTHLWEHVDRGVLTEMTRRAVQEADGLPVYYTEWGSLAGLPSDGAFGASFIPKTVLDGYGLVKGYSFWTFSDIVEENGQDPKEFFGGFGLMTQHGIPKAPYRAYQLLHSLHGEFMESRLADGTVDIYTVKDEEARTVQLLAVNHHSLLHEIQTEQIHIQLENGGRCIAADIQRVDETHANALAQWEAMGSPEIPSAKQLALLYAASCLEREPFDYENQGGRVAAELTIPPMGTALVTFYFD